jgi:hypothetical protein
MGKYFSKWYNQNMQNKNKKIIDELIVWYGTAAILIAYALISFELLSAKSFIYQVLNGTGALGIVYISFKKKAYQPGILNVIWAVIAVIAIVSIIMNG